jgi:thiamine pyrophosphate-dependent acetolactate synthase large subunit-like protein
MKKDESLSNPQKQAPEQITPDPREVSLGMREDHPSAGALFAEAFKAHDTEVAFGVHGAELMSILDTMSRMGIKLIFMHHEQTAVYAAEAYAKATGKPGVFFACTGPGSANVASALQQCYLSCSPAIGICGGTMAGHERSFGAQPSYAEYMFSRITKWTQRISGDYSVKHFISKAFKDAQAYPKGPCVIEFPSLSMSGPPTPPNFTTMAAQLLDQPKWRGEDTGKPLPQPGGDPELIEKAVEKICKAEKPLILAGDGIHWAGASEELVEFAELAQMLVIGRRLGRGAMPETHPNHIRWQLNRKILPQCDLLVLIGMKVGVFDSGFGQQWPKCIQINESPEHIWEFLNTDLAILGGPKVVLKQMITCLKANKLKPPKTRKDWIKEIQHIQKEYDTNLTAKALKYKDHKPIHHGWLCKTLWDTCENLYHGMNRIIIDGYTISGFIPAFPKARYSGQILDASEQAGVGHSIGMAIGAALGDPNARKYPVISLLGDGGLGIGGFEVETALRYELPVVYLVTNNDGWNTAVKYHLYGKQWEVLGPQDRQYGHEFVPGIRYDKLSDVFGVHGEFVNEPAEFRPALERALKSAENGKTSVLNVRVDPTLMSPAMKSVNVQAAYGHIPWDELPKKGKAYRRCYSDMFPWAEAGISPMDTPDPWEPVGDDEVKP